MKTFDERTATRETLRFDARRRWLWAGLLLVGAPAFSSGNPGKGAPRIEVWKSPTCGCCRDWIEHVRANGFEVAVNETGNAAVRARLGIPQALGSCHTAVVDGYALEGHVPASDIRRLLQERPKAVGLAVPGMPIGSPGMDGSAYGGRRDPFDVLLVHEGGKASTFRRVE